MLLAHAASADEQRTRRRHRHGPGPDELERRRRLLREARGRAVATSTATAPHRRQRATTRFGVLLLVDVCGQADGDGNGGRVGQPAAFAANSPKGWVACCCRCVVVTVAAVLLRPIGRPSQRPTSSSSHRVLASACVEGPKVPPCVTAAVDTCRGVYSCMRHVVAVRAAPFARVLRRQRHAPPHA